MSGLPSLDEVSFEALVDAPDDAAPPEPSTSMETPEGIELRSFYGPADLRSVEHTRTMPGIAPFVA